MVDPRTSLVPQTSSAIEPTRGVLDLARGATTGDVGARRHAASRERLLDRLSRPAPAARAPRGAGRSFRAYVLVAAAAAAAFALLGTGVVVARSRPAAVTAVEPKPAVPRAGTLRFRLDEGAPRPAARDLDTFQLHALACWQSALVEQPTMHGSVTLALTVDDAGQVSSATLAEHDGLSDEVARCVVRKASELAFERGKVTAFRLRLGFRTE